MRPYLRLLLCLPLLATTACAADAIAGPQRAAAPEPESAARAESEAVAAKVAAPAPDGPPPAFVFRCVRTIRAPSAGREPLYIIDGVVSATKPASLDRLDIDLIEVLKGAEAAAIYGSRAANGVLIITTRGGRSSTAQPVAGDHAGQ